MPEVKLHLVKNNKNNRNIEVLGVIANSNDHSKDRHLQEDKFFTRELANITMELFKIHLNDSIFSQEKEQLIKDLVNRAGNVVFDAFKKKTGIETDELIIFNNGDIYDLGEGSKITPTKLTDQNYLRIKRNRPYFDKGSGAPLKPPVKDLSKIRVSDAFLRAWDVRYVHDRLKKFLEKSNMRGKN